jgi:hypothetical protein
MINALLLIDDSDQIVVSRFVISKDRELPSFDFPDSKMLTSFHVYSTSNGPRDTSIQWSISNRDFAYRVDLTPRSVDSSNVQVSEILIACHVSSYFRDFVSPLHLVLKDRAPSSRSNDGRSSRSDPTSEICSPLLCVPPVCIQI